MAANGSKSVTVTSWDTLKFNWWIVSQNVANNTTVVGWNMQLVAGTSGKISSTASKDWSVTVNGTKYSGTNTVGVGNNTTKTLASGTTSVAHNSDGTKSFNYSFSQEFAITFSGSSIGTKSGSGSGTLTTIPRATTPTLSASSVNMGSSVTINTPRASSGFTHDLAYSFAGSGWVTIDTGVGTSKTWTVPDLATRIPNATSGTMTIRCITKNGSTSIGTKTVLLTVKVPTSVVPTISAVTLAEATSGLAAQFGAFIQNKSTVKTTITAAGAKGSTIKSYSTTFLGKTYTGSSWTSGLLTKSGSLSMVTKVTDSRGRTASKTTTLTVLAYTKPQVTEFVVRRVNEDGLADSNGTRASFSYAYTVAPLGNKNTAAMTITYKRSTETTWSSSILNGSSLTGSGLVLSTVNFPNDYQYDLRIQVKDWFGATSTYTAVLPSGAVIFDIKADGQGIAFGKTSEVAGVEFGWNVKTTKERLLWSGGYYMTEGHTITFKEKVKDQMTGIVLVFSEFVDGAAKDNTFSCHFVPKQQIAKHSGTGHCFNMMTSNLAYFATKYLYIRDDGITGHANNGLAGTASGSGITYANNRFVLRYVFGV